MTGPWWTRFITLRLLTVWLRFYFRPVLNLSPFFFSGFSVNENFSPLRPDSSERANREASPTRVLRTLAVLSARTAVHHLSPFFFFSLFCESCTCQNQPPPTSVRWHEFLWDIMSARCWLSTPEPWNLGVLLDTSLRLWDDITICDFFKTYFSPFDWQFGVFSHCGNYLLICLWNP